LWKFSATMFDCRHRVACISESNLARSAGTACALARLTDTNGINCCGSGLGEYDSFGTQAYRGFFLTGGGSFSGIDFW
jgi:hypothetical protein